MCGVTPGDSQLAGLPPLVAGRVRGLMKKTKLISAILVPLILVGSFALWVNYRCQKLQAAFDRLPIGILKANLTSRLGTPWHDGKCGEYFGGTKPGCAEEVIYAHPFAPWIPEYYSYQFDSGLRLVNKVHLVSP